MSIYKCTCGNYYTLPKEAEKLYNKVIRENKVIEFVSICPKCKHKSVYGGEPDYTYNENGDIMCFSYDYSAENKNLPHFKAIPLVKTIKNNAEFTTLEGSYNEKIKTIYLKKG